MVLLNLKFSDYMALLDLTMIFLIMIYYKHVLFKKYQSFYRVCLRTGSKKDVLGPLIRGMFPLPLLNNGVCVFGTIYDFELCNCDVESFMFTV